ncbi:MAG: 6-phosphogluconolactonase [Bilophila wadsworthia]
MDERCVAPDHPQTIAVRPSGAAGACQRRKSIRWTAKSIGESAVAYEELLRQHVPAEQGMPRLDCALLGMGDDGHTASLFPGSPLLAPEALRSGRLTGFAVAEHLAPKPESRRITLTLEMINAARCCLYLATGEGKRPPLGKALDLLAPASLPVQLVRPKGGELIWVMDEAACGGRQ